MISPRMDGVGAEHVKKVARAKPSSAPAPAQARLPEQTVVPSYLVVAQETDGVVIAVLIPKGLDRRVSGVALSHARNLLRSEKLALQWGMQYVLGEPEWIGFMEAMGNPPVPRVIMMGVFTKLTTP